MVNFIMMAVYFAGRNFSVYVILPTFSQEIDDKARCDQSEDSIRSRDQILSSDWLVFILLFFRHLIGSVMFGVGFLLDTIEMGFMTRYFSKLQL